MSKPTVKQKTYYQVGIGLGITMAGVASLCTYMLIEQSLKTTEIPVASPSSPDGILEPGDIVLAEDISMIEVGTFGFPNNIVRDINAIKGKYVTRETRADEFFYSYYLTDNYQKTLSEKVRYGAVSVPIDLISSVNADIKEDDFVMVKIIMGAQDEEDTTDYGNVSLDGKLPDSGVTIIDDEALAAVRVVGFYDSSSADVTQMKKANYANTDPNTQQAINPRMIVFDANPIQQALLLQGAYGGQIQLVILPEEEQIKHKKEWGLIDSEGNTVEDPIFADDTLQYKEQSEQLKQDAEKQKQEELELAKKLEEAAKLHAVDCEDPFTCKHPIHYNHLCPEDGECTHPIHHVLECTIVDCKDEAHDQVILKQ